MSCGLLMFSPMVTNDLVLSVTCLCLVREPADGVLSSAAVPRCGLGPQPPPLCRCAEYTIGQLLETWQMHHRSVPNHTFRWHDHSAINTALQGHDRSTPNHTLSQPWRLVCTAQRHKGGGRRPGDSRGAVHAKCQGVHSTSARAVSPPFERKLDCKQTQTCLRSEFQTVQ
jgi:hypothetical protein